MTPQEQIAAITDTIAQFPAEFGLMAFPGGVFRINPQTSYFGDYPAPGTLYLYTEKRTATGWTDFCKGTPDELRAQIVDAPARTIDADTPICYTVLRGNRPGDRIGIVKYGESGYYPVSNQIDNPAMTIEECKAIVGELNAKLELPEDVSESMQLASMFGWTVPVAYRAHAYFRAQRAAQEPAPAPTTIDLTPRGLQTPEGTARVNKAASEFEDATAQVANLATQFLELIQPELAHLEPDARETYTELRAAMTTRAARQEEFLRSIAGAPPAQ